MPHISDLDAPTFLENTVNGAPQIIDGDVTVTGGNFNGGVLTLIGLLAEDRVSVQTSGAITFNAATGEVRYNGVLIGQAAGGIGETFTVTFNADATAAGVEALVEHLTYANLNHDPTATRDLRLFLTDAAGAPSLGSVRFEERHGEASVVDRSPDLYARMIPDSFVVVADPSDPSSPSHIIFISSDKLEAFYIRFGPTASLELAGSSTDPYSDPGALGVTRLFIGFMGSFALGDLDADGFNDIVAAVGDNTIGFWRNSYGPSEAVAGGGPFAGIVPGGEAYPLLLDLDSDGDLDFVLSDYAQGVRYYENTGTRQAAVFTQRTGVDSPLGPVAASQTTPTFADVDGDGDLDVVVGQQGASLLYYENTGTAAAAVFTQRTGAQNPFDGISVTIRAKTLLADFDFDGDLDLIVRQSGGLLTYYENRLAGHALTLTVTPQADPNTSTNGDDLLTGSLAPDTLDGGLGADRLDGGAGDDTLYGGGGADILEGGTGADAMFGGTGNDTYIFDDEGDTADETGGDGVDLVMSLIDVVLPTAIENLTIAPSAGEANGTGNSLANVITGNAAANILLGQGGGDTLLGGGGNDTLGGGSGSDSLDGGDGDDSLNGGTDNDFLVGGAGNDLLNGGTGADQMAGGAGHDRYVVDNVGDALTEAAGGGTDTVESAINFALGANFENLTLTGGTNLAGTGNAMRNTLTGNTGDNFLDGGTGTDTLIGGDGNDYLKGGDGADAMTGGLGDDTYVIENLGDSADETGGDGVDLVLSRISWTLGAGIENLTLGASGLTINGTGNDVGNLITGNDFANVLLGEAGEDILVGKGGKDDLYGGDGDDTLDGGSFDDKLYGGAGGDDLIGGAGNDTLDGGAGNDDMAGGLGNDIYVVDDALDTVIEDVGGGLDTARVSADWILADNVENLIILGGGDLSVGGNGLRNAITGGVGSEVVHAGGEADTVFGGEGDDDLFGEDGGDTLGGGGGGDQLIGGAGNDRLTGGGGADRFVFGETDLISPTVERDQILDLVFADGDIIDLSAIDAKTGTVGVNDAFSFVTTFSKQAGQATLKYSAPLGVTTLELDVDGDGKADFRIAITGDHSATTGNLYTGAGDANGGWLL